MTSKDEQAIALLSEEKGLESDAPWKYHASLTKHLNKSISFIIFLYAAFVTAPASHIVQYEMQEADPYKYTIYADHPSEAVDTAWDNLIRPIYFAASRDEVLQSNETPDDTTRLMDYDGYLGNLGVFHGLHCLRRMYWHLNEEIYFPNRTAEQREAEVTHALHCLGVIVKDMMCTPDLALYTFGITPELKGHINYKSKSQRKCVRWEPFHEWAMERSSGWYPRMKAPINMPRNRAHKAEMMMPELP